MQVACDARALGGDRRRGAGVAVRGELPRLALEAPGGLGVPVQQAPAGGAQAERDQEDEDDRARRPATGRRSRIPAGTARPRRAATARTSGGRCWPPRTRGGGRTAASARRSAGRARCRGGPRRAGSARTRGSRPSGAAGRTRRRRPPAIEASVLATGAETGPVRVARPAREPRQTSTPHTASTRSVSAPRTRVEDRSRTVHELTVTQHRGPRIGSPGDRASSAGMTPDRPLSRRISPWRPTTRRRRQAASPHRP